MLLRRFLFLVLAVTTAAAVIGAASTLAPDMAADGAVPHPHPQEVPTHE